MASNNAYFIRYFQWFGEERLIFQQNVSFLTYSLHDAIIIRKNNTVST